MTADAANGAMVLDVPIKGTLGVDAHTCVWGRLLVMTKCCQPFAGLVGILLLVGCGQNVGTVEVSGTVLADGTPAGGLTVQFSPASGERPSTGFTDASGRFALRYNKDIAGVLPGKHQVTFSWSAQTEGQEPTPAQQAVLAKHGAQGGKPYAVDITGPTPDLLIAVDTAK